MYGYGLVAKAANNKPGLGTIYIAPTSYFTTIQNPPTTGAIGVKKKIATAHIPVTDKGFFELLGLVTEKSTGKGTTGGDKGSKDMKFEVEIFVAGLNAELLDLIDSGLNDDWIVLAQNGSCGAGEYLQIGCKCTPADMSAELNTGTGEPSGSKGATIKFMATGVPDLYTASVPIYNENP